jgi:hypothetical protein
VPLSLRALVLLLVFGHAVLAGATHFHRVSRQAGEPAASAHRDEADDGPSAKGHLQCVLCRLQRQFVSDHRPSGPRLIVPTSAARGPEGRPSPETSDAHPLLKRGRAPPLA